MSKLFEYIGDYDPLKYPEVEADPILKKEFISTITFMKSALARRPTATKTSCVLSVKQPDGTALLYNIVLWRKQ